MSSFCRARKEVYLCLKTEWPPSASWWKTPQCADKLNALLHDYGEYIIGRMGIPYRQKGISVLSVVMDAPAEAVNALTGKLGMLEGVSAKTLFSKY